MKESYSAKFRKYSEKGYIWKLSKEDITSVIPRTWYVLHFGVTNPNKPSKLRLVINAAEESNGMSLNKGAGSIEACKKLRKDLFEINEAGGFHLCKFNSNSREVLESIPVDLRAVGAKSLNEISSFVGEREKELHVFVDASHEAYASIAYLRYVHESEEISVDLFRSKARVAPVRLGERKITISDLELQGAVLGSRFAFTIKCELISRLDRNVFWSDSKVVLSWICADDVRHKEFEANRVDEIQEATASGNGSQLT
ncbi:hypothetical protein LAZ67_14002304 [Cordylochernes scorpioides]|uniref:Uncharacterized protein n=1 Tax=Cordylochernes scorpioides TaxID=51811 RepID=A0ABY6LBR2_9ARAC|nr:hypothetical protein LAZ67_14002304 [Cordylochernes scorpioides]